MKSLRLEEEQKHHKKSDTWRPLTPRMSKSRRLILLAACSVALIILWQYQAPNHIYDDLKAEIPSTLDRRSQKYSNVGSSEQGSIGRILVVDGSKQLEKEDSLLSREDSPSARFDAPEKDNLHGVQLEQQQQHLEHQHDDDEVVAGHDDYARGASTLEPKVVDEEDSIPEDTGNDRGRADDEEHNPGHSAGQQETLAVERIKVPQLPNDGEDAIILSNTDTKEDTKPLEKEPKGHLSLEEKGEALPEILHIPLEDAVADTKLAGWEDQWVAHATFDVKKWGFLEEPKIDFVYLWVNGSETAFQNTKRPYEENSILNDVDGVWYKSHGTNRYRDWDELKYSLRSLEAHASGFRNKVHILVNSVEGTKDKKQVPSWLNDKPLTKEIIQVLAQEDFFDTEKHVCLPTFNSLTIENQIFNTPSDVDNLFALSDDMLLGRPHAASDIYSPLFGPVMGFKTNMYNTVNTPTAADAARFGEKPFLIYTSWLLNRRFGNRKRAGQGHFGHSLSRSVTREAIGSFPGPEVQSACKRFRGEPGFQLYSWYATFHYLIERHREALLWSYIMLRSDVDSNGNLGWAERQTIISELEAGMKNEGRSTFRKRNFYHVTQLLERAGLEAPKVNTDIQWTSLDGPAAIRGLDCSEFDVNECLAPGFSSPMSDARTANPIFSSTVVFDRLARQQPKCGDCLLKLLLNQQARGLSPLLPPNSKPQQRELVIKAVMRYRYTIIQPDALFVMVTDAEQVDSTLVSRFVRQKKPLAGQLCLNDDVSTEDEEELRDVMTAMTELYQGLFPEKSLFEK